MSEWIKTVDDAITEARDAADPCCADCTRTALTMLAPEVERLRDMEGRAVQFLNRPMPDADAAYADGYHAACDDILTYHHGGMRAEVERLRGIEKRAQAAAVAGVDAIVRDAALHILNYGG